jgi:hypothetical protein
VKNFTLARIIAVAKDFDAVLSFGFEFVGTTWLSVSLTFDMKRPVTA